MAYDPFRAFPTVSEQAAPSEETLDSILDEFEVTDPAVRERVIRLAGVESSGKLDATGPTLERGMHAGDAARGALQIMPKTAKAYPQYDLDDPADATRAGLQYFLDNLTAFGGDLDAATVAHHGGPGAARKWLKEGKAGTIDLGTGLTTDDYLRKVRGGDVPAAEDWSAFPQSPEIEEDWSAFPAADAAQPAADPVEPIPVRAHPGERDLGEQAPSATKPKIDSVMADYQPAQKPLPTPANAKARAFVKQQYDAHPDKRAAMVARQDWLGAIARQLEADYAAQDQKSLPTLDKVDQRLEAKIGRNRAQGMDPATAAMTAQSQLIGGEAPVGSIKESDFDFELKQHFEGANPALRGAVKGYEGYRQGVLGMLQAGAELTGADYAAGQFAQGAKDAAGNMRAIGEGAAGARHFENAVASLTQQLPLLIGGAVTGGQALVLSGMAIQSFGQEYSEGRNAGLKGPEAATRAGLFAAFEVIGEKFGLGEQLFAIKALARGAPLEQVLGLLAKALAKEVPGELLTTTGQFGTDKAPGIGLNPDAALQDYMKQVADTVIQTVMQTGMMMGGSAAISQGVRMARGPGGELQDLVEGSEFVQRPDEVAARLLDPSNAQLMEAQRAPALDATSYQGPGPDAGGGAGLASNGGVGTGGAGGAAGPAARSGGAGVAVGDAAGELAAGVDDPVDALILEKEAQAIATGDPVEVLVTQAEGAVVRAAANPVAPVEEVPAPSPDTVVSYAQLQTQALEGGNLLVSGENAAKAVRELLPDTMLMPGPEGAVVVPARFAPVVQEAVAGAQQQVSAEFQPGVQAGVGAALLGFPQQRTQPPAKKGETPALLRGKARPDGTMEIPAPIEEVQSITAALGVRASALRMATGSTLVGAQTADQVNAALRYALEPFQYDQQDEAGITALAQFQGAEASAIELVTPATLPAEGSADGRLSAPAAIFLGRVLAANGRKLVLYRAGKDVGLGGAALPGQPGRVFLNVETSYINPVAEAVHEVGHTIRMADEGAYQSYLGALRTSMALDTSDAALIGWAQANFGSRSKTPVTTIAQAIGVANVPNKGVLLEEFIMDATGRASREGKFWDTVFAELQRENPSALQAFVKAFKALAEKLRRELFNYGHAFHTIDPFIRDIEKLAELAGKYYAKGAAQNVSGTHSPKGNVVASRDRVGPYEAESLAKMNRDWYANKEGVQYEIEQTPEGYFLNRVGEADGQQAAGQRDPQPEVAGQRNRADGEPSGAVAGTAGDGGGRGQLGRDVPGGAVRGDQQAQGVRRPSAALPESVRSIDGGQPGSVELVGIHFSRAPRQSLSGSYFGTGHTSEEGARLRTSKDNRIRQRLYLYVNEGKGVTPEAGVGSHAHAVRAKNIYDLGADPKGLRRQVYGIEDLNDRANALESAILDAGFDGYYQPGAFTSQGVAIILGDAASSVPTESPDQPNGVVARSGAETALSRAKAVAARARGLKGLPAGQMQATRWRDALMGVDEEVFQAFEDAGLFDTDETLYLSELAGRYVRQAMDEPAVKASGERTIAKENTVSVTVGGKPGEFGWSPAAKMAAEAALQDYMPAGLISVNKKTKGRPVVDPQSLIGVAPPPFVGPTQQAPNLVVVGEAVRKVLSAKAARDTIEALTGAKVADVTQIAGSWEGKPEPSFVLSGEMSFEQANEVSKLLGFLMAQDATVVAQPWFEEAADQIPAILISQNKAMSADQVKALSDAAREAGLDYSTTVDGRGAKFLHFGDQDGYLKLRAAVDEIRKAAGLKELTDFYVRSNLNDAETYLESGVGSLLREERDQAGDGGPSDLFRRAVDSILVPYAKAVGAEGYRFSPERYGQRFGLTEGEVEYIRAALRPKSGKALSTVSLVTGAEKLEPPRNNLRTKDPGVTKNDLLWALQNRAAQIGFIEPGDYSPEARKIIADAIADEVIYNLGKESGKNAVGWYDDSLKAAKKTYEEVFPELRQDADQEMLFDALLGIASQGNDVHSNAVFAGRMYYLITREGMTIGQATRALSGTFGEKTTHIEGNYLKLERLLDINGYDRMREFFNTKATVGELNAILRKDKSLFGLNGKPLKIDGASEQTVTGWMVFGPKIGSFINNLHGDYSTLTADLWFSRTWNRLLGYVFKHGADKESSQYITLYRAMLEEARTGEGRDVVGWSPLEIERLAADPESMVAFAREAHRNREVEYKKLKNAAVTPLRQAAKNLLETRSDATEIPRSDWERYFQQTTVEQAQKTIRRKTGVNISIADIQAVLWYHEKDLYKSFGVGDSKAEAADYADAARRFVDRFNEGDLFYVEKPKPRYLLGTKGSYLAQTRAKGADGFDDAGVRASLRRDPPPQKTVTAYKLFRVDARRPGQLFPLFVDANTPVALDTWYDADVGELTASGKVKSKIGPLAYRPGWHAGDLPLATHIGGKTAGSTQTAPDYRPDNQVWAEIEMAADVDWQAEADRRAKRTKAGKPIANTAHITDQVPVNGFYRYKTNPNMTGNWLIGGAMKVTRILSDAEVERINAAAGAADLPRLEPFDAARFGFRASATRDALGFYSQLARAVQGVPDRLATQPAPQWKLWLASNASKLGVKADEIQWSGINEWLDLQGKRKVEKGEVLAYLEQGGVKVEEVAKGEMTPAMKGRTLVELGWSVEDVARLSDRELEAAYLLSPDDAKDFLDRREAYDPEMSLSEVMSRLEDYGYREEAKEPDTKYQRFALPGGKNYREVLLTLPATRKQTQARRARIVEIQDRAFLEGGRDLTDAETKEISDLRAAETMEGATARDRVFTSNHWNEKNVLAHIRMNDRTTTDGLRVLFIEEIQSDWGQAGRAAGFGEVANWTDAQIRAAVEANDPNADTDGLDRATLLEMARNGGVTLASSVPAAPFVTDTKAWVGLAVKRVITLAAEEGYDAVAFVNGQQSAERYSLRKSIESIGYDPKAQVLTGYDAWRKEVLNESNVSPAKLPDYLGKEVADRLLATPLSFGKHLLDGEEIEVGGEGMKSFYDRIVPQVTSDILKKLGGGKIVQISMPAEEADAATDELYTALFREPAPSSKILKQLGFDITPAMREKVTTEGVPLFSRTRNAPPAAVFSAPTMPDTLSKRALDSVVYQFQDRFTDLKAIQKNIEAAGRTIRDEFNPYMAETLMHGKAAYRVGTFLEQEVTPLLRLMRGANIQIDEINEYLHARHAKERNAAMARRNPNQAELDQLIQDAGEELLDAELELTQDPNSGALARRVERAQAHLDALRATKPWSGTEEERQRLSGMSNADAQQILARIRVSSKGAVFQRIGEKIDQITAKTRAEMAAYGLESADTVAAMDAAYQHYVPLQRDMDESDLLNTLGGTGRGLSIRGSQVKRATGSLRDVENILAHLVAQREATIVRGEKNRVAKALYGLVMEHPNPELFAVIRPGMSEAELRGELQAMGLDPDTVETMVMAPTTATINERTGLAERRVNALYSRLENAVVLRVAGEDRVILFNKSSDRAVRLVRALRNDDSDFGGASGFVMKWIGPLTRYLAAINTQYNPVFGLTNFSRDLQGAMLNLQTTELADHKAAVLRNVAPALRGIWNWERGDRQDSWAKIYEEFLADGGATGFRDQYSSLEDRARAIERELGQTGLRNAKGIKQVLDLLSDYNTAIENATRLAAYKAARDAGMARARAADLAKDVTVNFNRKGARSGVMASLYAFFNSGVQGTERTLRVLNSPIGHKLLAAGVALGAMQAVIGILGLGKDDWDEVPEFERAKHLIFPILGSDGKYVKIPMPLGFHAVPNIGRSIVEMVFYRDRLGERGLNLLVTTLDAINPLGSSNPLETIMPSVADPFIQAATNKTAFGRPIEREDFSTLAPTPGWTRAKEETSSVFKALAYATNWATSGGKEFEVGLVSPTPEMLSFFTGVVTGGLGREIEKAASFAEGTRKGDSMPPYKIPVVSRFYGAAGGDAAIRSKYYATIKEINEAEFAMKRSIADGKPADDYFAVAGLASGSRKIQSSIAELNKARQAEKDPAIRKALEQEVTTLQALLVELREDAK